MLRRLKQFFKKLFSRKSPSPIDPKRSKPKVAIGDKVGGVTIQAQYQLDKHTDFKPGESYRVGEMVVTVHKDKASMLAAIAATDARREAHHAALTKRAEDIMMMSPEELRALKIDEWLGERNKKHSIIQGIMGGVGLGRYIKPIQAQPSGSKEERFKELMKEVKVEEKVS